MSRSVNFTLNDISSFISGVDDISSQMNSTLSDVQDAVRNTVTRLQNAISQYEEQLRVMTEDQNMAYSVRFDAERAKKNARAELDSLYDRRAKMSEEEQKSIASAVKSAENKYDAMCRAYEVIDRIYKQLGTKISTVRETVRTLDGNVRAIEKELKSFEQTVYSYSRLVSELKASASDARGLAARAVEALGDGSAYEDSLQIRISNINTLGELAEAVGIYSEHGKEGLNALSRSAKEAEYLMQSATIAAAGVNVSQMEAAIGEATVGLREYGRRADTAYRALNAYLKYENISIR